MYGLDINFLKDRDIRPVAAAATARPQAAPGSRQPLLLGLAFALIAVGAVAGYWAFLQQQNRQLEQRQAELDQQLAALRSQLQEVEAVRSQIAIIQQETTALVSVFEEIRPWSALLQDIRSRIPQRVRLERLTQSGGNEGETAEDGTRALRRAGSIQVEGQACSFDDVNDFMLVLQRSPFLLGETVRIESASLQDSLLDPAVDGTCPGARALALVNYNITGEITNVPASTLLQEIEARGTVGLVARIRALQETGVVQP